MNTPGSLSALLVSVAQIISWIISWHVVTAVCPVAKVLEERS